MLNATQYTLHATQVCARHDNIPGSITCLQASIDSHYTEKTSTYTPNNIAPSDARASYLPLASAVRYNTPIQWLCLYNIPRKIFLRVSYLTPEHTQGLQLRVNRRGRSSPLAHSRRQGCHRARRIHQRYGKPRRLARQRSHLLMSTHTKTRILCVIKLIH